MLYLECYPFDGKLKPLSFYKYTVDVIEPRGAVLKSVLNSAARRLNKSVGYGAGYFACADEKFIFTQKEIVPEHLSCNYQGIGKTYIYRLVPQGKETLSFASHANIYASYLKQHVMLRLLKKRFISPMTKKEEAFYFLRDNMLLSKYLIDIKTDKISEIISREGIQLLRQYDFHFEILSDGSGYLYLDTCSRYEALATLYDFIKRASGRLESVLNMKVKYDCPLSTPMYGTIISRNDLKNNVFSTATTASIFKYFKEKYTQNPKRTMRFLESIPKDDYVIFLRLNNSHGAFAVLSSLTRPIVTQEYIASHDAAFSKTIGVFTKRNMQSRFLLDKRFINDIGELPNCDGVRVLFKPTKAINLGYREKHLVEPVLVIGQGREISCDQKSKNAIFDSSGYFFPPPIFDNHLRIGVICTDTFDHYTFIRKLSRYLNIPKKYKPCAYHDFGTKKDLLFSLQEIRNQNFDINIVVMPDDGFIGYNLYNEMKTCLAELGIPSQMLNLRTADKIIHGDKFSAMNIAMGCLGKLGGIPYVIRDILGNIDLFVGLDVGTLRSGIHYPSCSVCLDSHGRIMGCYQPLLPQSGEKIDEQTLEDIFNRILLEFEKKFQRKIRNIVIHRDGFSNENIDWYDNYFRLNGIDYTLVEVRKSGAPRLGDNDCSFQGNNPKIGSILYHDDSEAILITTSPYEKMGAPRPIRLVKVKGSLDIEMISQQIYALTKIHVGAKQNTRLPITTNYADKICKNLQYIPKNQFLYKLYFL